MPGLDGFGLFKTLQQNTATAKIPVIVVTNGGKMSDTFTSMEVADFLAKPFDAAVLLKTIDKHLSATKPNPAKQECIDADATAYIGSFNENTFIKSISKYL